MHCSSLNSHLYRKNIVDTSSCTCVCVGGGGGGGGGGSTVLITSLFNVQSIQILEISTNKLKFFITAFMTFFKA